MAGRKPGVPGRKRGEWAQILERGAKIVESYDIPVTLRQLFYRLVSEGQIRNTRSDYGQLSARTAEARRLRDFPDLFDGTRTIDRIESYSDPGDALRQLAERYALDRTEGQGYELVIAGEKATLSGLLWQWFGDLGVPVTALRGYDSQTHVDDMADLAKNGRAVRVIYAGDFDASGEDLTRDFVERSGLELTRIAVLPEHIERFNLPPALGKSTDTRAAGFEARHGRLVQVEVEALPPNVLRDLYLEEFNRWWDPTAYASVLEREAADRNRLVQIAAAAK